MLLSPFPNCSQYIWTCDDSVDFNYNLFGMIIWWSNLVSLVSPPSSFPSAPSHSRESLCGTSGWWRELLCPQPPPTPRALVPLCWALRPSRLKSTGTSTMCVWKKTVNRVVRAGETSYVVISQLKHPAWLIVAVFPLLSSCHFLLFLFIMYVLTSLGFNSASSYLQGNPFCTLARLRQAFIYCSGRCCEVSKDARCKISIVLLRRSSCVSLSSKTHYIRPLGGFEHTVLPKNCACGSVT